MQLKRIFFRVISASLLPLVRFEKKKYTKQVSETWKNKRITLHDLVATVVPRYDGKCSIHDSPIYSTNWILFLFSFSMRRERKTLHLNVFSSPRINRFIAQHCVGNNIFILFFWICHETFFLFSALVVLRKSCKPSWPKQASPPPPKKNIRSHRCPLFRLDPMTLCNGQRRRCIVWECGLMRHLTFAHFGSLAKRERVTGTRQIKTK